VLRSLPTQALHSVGGETRATGGEGGSTLQDARAAAKQGRTKNWRIVSPKKALIGKSFDLSRALVEIIETT
jgi:hypothetical protein